MSILEDLRKLFDVSTISESVRETLFSSEEHINDLAVRLALTGKGLEYELQRIRGFYERKIEPIKLRLQSIRDHYAMRISQSEAEISRQEQIRNESRDEITAIDNDQRSLRNTLTENRAKKSVAWLKILQQRNEKGRQFFEAQNAKTQGGLGQDWDYIKTTLENQQDIEKQIFQIQKENYEASKPEYERRAKQCEDRFNRIETKLEKLDSDLDHLATFGATRFSAKFLLIVGVVSLVGAGTVVANLLQGRSPGPDLLTWILISFREVIKGLFKNIPGPWAPAATAVAMILSVLVFLGVFYGIIVLSYKLRLRFEKRVSEDGGSTKESKTKPDKRISRKREEKQSFYSQITGALKDSQGLKSYFDFISTGITSHDYSNLIASFPFIFLVAILVLLLSAGSGQNFSLSTAYIGIVVILLSTSCCILYTIRIIEPRWLRYLSSLRAAESSQSKKAVGLVRLNIEIALLIFLLLACLLLATIVPSGDFSGLFPEGSGWKAFFIGKPSQHLVWGALAIFVSLSSFAFAYGVVLYGIYGNYDFLARKREVLRSWIEKYRTQPTIGGDDFYSFEYPIEWVNDEIDRLHQLRDFETWYEMNDVFGEDIDFRFPPSENDAYSRLSSYLYRTKEQLLSFLRRRSDVVQVVLPTDTSPDPTHVREFESSLAAINAATDEVRACEARISDLRSIVAQVQVRIDQLNAQILELLTERDQKVQELVAQINKLDDEQEKDLLAFSSAYGIASIAYELLRREGILNVDPFVELT